MIPGGSWVSRSIREPYDIGHSGSHMASISMDKALLSYASRSGVQVAYLFARISPAPEPVRSLPRR